MILRNLILLARIGELDLPHALAEPVQKELGAIFTDYLHASDNFRLNSSIVTT